MNVGIAVVGVAAAVAIGAALEVQRRRERAVHVDLVAHGVRRPGRVVAVEATGRFAAFRRVIVEVDGRRVIETLAAAEATELGLCDGAVVTVLVDDGAGDGGAGDSGAWRGRLLRERSFDRDRPVGVLVGVVIGLLALAAALVS